MKKVLSVLLAVLLLSAFSGYTDAATGETASQPALTIVQDRVISVTCEDFDINAAIDYFASAYDWFYNGTAEPEYAIPEFLDDIGYNSVTSAADPEGAKATMVELMEKNSSLTWQERIEQKTWKSTFITAVNVTDKVLNVHFSEHYGIEFTVAFE